MKSRDINQRFTDIIQKSIVPIFVNNGFKNNNLDFCKTINDISQVFQIKKLKTENDLLTFTINVGYYNFEMYKIVIGNYKRPIPFIRDCFLTTNIGFLTSESGLYTIDDTILQTPLVEKISFHLETFVKPLFNIGISFSEIVRIEFEQQFKLQFQLHPYTKSVFYFLGGKKLKAEEELKKLYNLFLEQRSQDANEKIIKLYSEMNNLREENIERLKRIRELETIEKNPNQFYVNEIKRIAKIYDIEL